MASFSETLVSNNSPNASYDTLCQHAIVTGAIVSASAFLYYYTRYTYWSRRSIKGPLPLPILGTSIYEIIHSKNVAFTRWGKKYGRVFGVYQGVEPHLVVSDADIIRDILVKDTHIFPNHREVKFSDKYTANMLFFQRDEKWRQLRSLMTFTFTSGKIKKMFNLMKSSSDDLIDNINKKVARNEPIDIKMVYGCFTLDVIARCAFAMKFDTKESEQKYRQDLVAMLIADFRKIHTFRLFLLAVTPDIVLKATGFKIPGMKSQKHLVAISRKIIESRHKDRKTVRHDLLQLLLDLDRSDKTNTANVIDVIDNDSSESHYVANYDKQELKFALEEAQSLNQSTDLENLKEKSKLRLSDDEIIGNCILFFLAGYETTSSLLSFASYALACHPSIQEKLYQEVKASIEREAQENKNNFFEYETVLSMQFLDAVISETLRMFPPAPVVDRQANEDYKIPSLGITIPAGRTIQVHSYSVHYDPEYYPEPTRFDPSRFLPENRHKHTPYTFLPFGAGIRHCLGMRFALAEAKLGLARLVYNYKFTPVLGAKARFPPKISKSSNILVSEELDVKLTKR